MLLSSSPPESSGVQIATANGIWTKDTIKASYQDIVKKDHSAIADVIPETYGPINQFVSEKTGGMIKDLMTGNLDPLTVAIIVNAVFFKG